MVTSRRGYPIIETIVINRVNYHVHLLACAIRLCQGFNYTRHCVIGHKSAFKLDQWTGHESRSAPKTILGRPMMSGRGENGVCLVSKQAWGLSSSSLFVYFGPFAEGSRVCVDLTSSRGCERTWGTSPVYLFIDFKSSSKLQIQ